MNKLSVVIVLMGLWAPARAGEFVLNQPDLGRVVSELNASQPRSSVSISASGVRTEAYNDRFESNKVVDLDVPFNDLVTLGVRAYAEGAAWDECHAKGNNYCKVQMNRIDYCNRPTAGGKYECSATAAVYAEELPPLYDWWDANVNVEKGFVTDPTRNSDLATLEVLGAREMAVIQGMATCREHGDAHCLLNFSDVRCGAWGTSYSCQATARIFGWR